MLLHVLAASETTSAPLPGCSGHDMIVNYLLNYYPGLEVDKRDARGLTALMKAAIQGCNNCVTALVLAGEWLPPSSMCGCPVAAPGPPVSREGETAWVAPLPPKAPGVPGGGTARGWHLFCAIRAPLWPQGLT